MHPQIDPGHADQQAERRGQQQHRPAPAGVPGQQYQGHRQGHRPHRMATGETERRFRRDRFPQAGALALEEVLAAHVQQRRADEADADEGGLAPAPVSQQHADDQHIGRDQEPLVAQPGDEHEEAVQQRRMQAMHLPQQGGIEMERFKFVHFIGQRDETGQRQQHATEQQQQAPGVARHPVAETGG
ncbi:hypothetical protein G6F65_010844 [Rhizopus arrhizus]|nr:hypothetical protein G6F31_013389 [Rhizopus arrhizus]KAG1273786.1 hypothetical protein G6F65_010844 [Rhizopus arrhizus]